jgi:hypothetical protein
VQLENKIVEDLEARHAESRGREDVEERAPEALPSQEVEAVVHHATEVRGELLGAIRMVLEHQPIEISALQLPEREKGALEALVVAVEGRNPIGEQALAVLQPDLTRADDQTARELQVQFADLTDHVGELRHTLTNLEDAQDELVEGRHELLGKAADEPADKPKPKPSDPDAPRPPTTLTGPERPEPPRPASTLSGAERPEPQRPASTVSGPERPEPPRPPTTLSGPDRPELPRPASTLSGPDRPEPPRPASTVYGPEGAEPAAGAAAETEASKTKRPWWRKPFG